MNAQFEEPSAKWIDIHTHLSSPDFDQDRSDVMNRALETCSLLIDIGSGTSSDAFKRAMKLAESHSQVYFTAGVHPHDASSVLDATDLRAEIEKALEHPKCVAVGECGLDYYYQHSSREAQAEVFRWQIDLAKKYNLPLMIHTRDAEHDTIGALETFEGSAVFHCFTGSPSLADFGLRKGFYISFSGIVTFKKATDLQEIAKQIPLENLLIETDSPYLAPIPLRGKRCESSFVKHTAEFICELRGITADTLANQVQLNASRLFRRILR